MRRKQIYTAADSAPDVTANAEQATREIIEAIPKDKLVLLKIMHGDDGPKIAAAWQALQAQKVRMS